jgi:hypothetical protein
MKSDSTRAAEGKIQLSIVIPAYQEEGNLEKLWNELKEVLSSLGLTWEIIFADDGSGTRPGNKSKPCTNMTTVSKASGYQETLGINSPYGRVYSTLPATQWS